MSSSTRSQQASLQQMGILEKLGIFQNLAMSYAFGFAALLTGVFRDADQRPPLYYKHVAYTIIREICGRMSVRQLHAISPPTDEVYAQLCKKNRITPNSEILEDGTRAHWIGSSSAEKVIINFHGGGYVLPAGPAYMEFMWQLQQYLSKEGKDVAVLFLSYDLAPVAQYPRQLQQAAALLHHVVNKLNKLPQNIVLTGDSAGANLAMSLMSHLSHPHPSKSHPIIPITLTSPLRGLVLTSPWISFSTDGPGITRNAAKDLLDGKAGRRWSEAFMNSPVPHTSNTDYYNEAITAPDEWWKDLQVEEILILAGKDEVLADSIIEFADHLKRIKKEVTLFVAEGEAHDMTNLDIQLGYKEPGAQASLIRSWIQSKL